RECLDLIVIFGEAHLRRILSAYAAYKRMRHCGELSTASAALSNSGWATSSICTDMIFGKDIRASVCFFGSGPWSATAPMVRGHAPPDRDLASPANHGSVSLGIGTPAVGVRDLLYQWRRTQAPVA